MLSVYEKPNCIVNAEARQPLRRQWWFKLKYSNKFELNRGCYNLLLYNMYAQPQTATNLIFVVFHYQSPPLPKAPSGLLDNMIYIRIKSQILEPINKIHTDIVHQIE